MIRTPQRRQLVERINQYGYGLIRQPARRSRPSSWWRSLWLSRDARAILDGAPGTHALSDGAPMSRPPR